MTQLWGGVMTTQRISGRRLNWFSGLVGAPHGHAGWSTEGGRDIDVGRLRSWFVDIVGRGGGEATERESCWIRQGGIWRCVSSF